MMANVLVSLIGTGKQAAGDKEANNYVTTDYLFEGKKYADRTLIVDVLLEAKPFDKVYLIGTAESMWDNVADVFGADEDYVLDLYEKKENGSIEEKDLVLLQKLLDERTNGAGSRILLVENGESEAELWRIFDQFMKIYDGLSKEDAIHLDVTHLFRSHSIFSFVVSELAGISKGVKVEGLYYGMLKQDEPSVILDMSIFFELLDWAKAIRNLKRYGNPMFLTEMMPKLGDDETERVYRNFAYALAVSDVAAMMQNIKYLKGKLGVFRKLEHHIATMVHDELRSFIERFDGVIDNTGRFQYALAKFYADTQNYPMAYISLTEAIVSRVCHAEGLDETDEEDRKEAKRIIVKEYRESPNDKYIRDVYVKVNNIRNNIAHKTTNSSRYSRTSPKDVIGNLDTYLSKIAPLFREK